MLTILGHLHETRLTLDEQAKLENASEHDVEWLPPASLVAASVSPHSLLDHLCLFWPYKSKRHLIRAYRALGRREGE